MFGALWGQSLGTLRSPATLRGTLPLTPPFSEKSSPKESFEAIF